MTKQDFISLIEAHKKQAQADIANEARATARTLIPPEVSDLYLELESHNKAAAEVKDQLYTAYKTAFAETQPDIWSTLRYGTLNAPARAMEDAVKYSKAFKERAAELEDKFRALVQKVQRTKAPDKLLEIANLFGMDVGGEITGAGVDAKGIDVAYLKPIIKRQKAIAG